jgi:6-phosphogluconolactonase (cycloisomerase 2 family)
MDHSPQAPKNNPALVNVTAGSGLWRLVIGKDGQFVYAINEMLCMVPVFRCDAAGGSLSYLLAANQDSTKSPR